jgi:membrane-anchored protein YejM (alkaline phosphatase superfamily)
LYDGWHFWSCMVHFASVHGAILTWILMLLKGLWSRRAMIILPVSIEMHCHYLTWMEWPTIRSCSADPYLYMLQICCRLLLCFLYPCHQLFLITFIIF